MQAKGQHKIVNAYAAVLCNDFQNICQVYSLFKNAYDTSHEVYSTYTQTFG